MAEAEGRKDMMSIDGGDLCRFEESTSSEEFSSCEEILARTTSQAPQSADAGPTSRYRITAFCNRHHTTTFVLGSTKYQSDSDNNEEEEDEWKRLETKEAYLCSKCVSGATCCECNAPIIAKSWFVSIPSEKEHGTYMCSLCYDDTHVG